MVFYVSLFLFSLVMASIVVWIYRAIDTATHRTYKAFLPSSNENPTTAAIGRVQHRRRQASGTPTPWGWKKTTKSGVLTSVAVPARAAAGAQVNVGWPYRDEPYSSSTSSRTLGKAKPGSKVTGVRKVAMGGVDKPWGW